MEENNAQQSFSQLCKMGCGYFGSSNFDGLCSQCHKDKQQECGNSHTLNNAAYSTYKEKPFSDVKETAKQEDVNTKLETSSEETCSIKPSSSTSSISSIVTGDINKIDISLNSKEVSPVSVPSTKKSRCLICRKKLGLTGFGCRCGGEFCSIHRYSDSHSCTFDYKVEAEDAIRKANPRIVSNKISKI